MILPLLICAVTVLPADRLAMADRLFNKGDYADAAAEYRALKGEKDIAADEILFRLAECDRSTGKNADALKGYEEVFTHYPESKHAVRARFMHAMGHQGLERHRLLSVLDTDRIDLETRTAALYYLGSETSDADVLAKCVKLAPKGKYAPYANLKYGTLLNASDDAATRRKGVEVLLGLAFGDSVLADEALYLAAIQSYREKRYGEAGSLFRRYRKLYPQGTNFEESRSMSAWCDFLEGRYADAAATCGAGETDDLAYILAACAYSTGDTAKALELFKSYAEKYPNGRYVADAKLPIARIEFEMARADNDAAKTVESAKRGFGLSKLAADQLRLAWAYENAKKPNEARAEYESVVKAFPGTAEAAEALYRKAMIDIRAESWSVAELALAEALSSGRLGKRAASALYWRGIAAIRIGHEAEGVKFLADAEKAGLGLDESREARLMIADFDCRNGQVEKGKAAYVRLVREGACERMSLSRIYAVGKMVGGEEAKTCAKALTASTAPEWRQAGWALMGACEEAQHAYTVAIESYRKCMSEKAETEDLASAAFRLGQLESRAGELDAADRTLKRAIALNAANARVRAEAYLLLAKNAGARQDWKSAVAYATVITSLFEDSAVCAEAKKIIADHPEAQE